MRAVPSRRRPGRRPGPPQRTELLRIWDALDADSRKLVLFIARQAARENGLLPSDALLVITNRAF
jgi:hypothetical protein